MNNLISLKGLFVFFLGFFAFSTASNFSTDPDKNSVKKKAMTEKINEMYDRFMEYRSKSSEIFVERGWNSEEMVENEELMKKADATNYLQAKALVEKYGMPTNSKVGEELAHKFWMIVINCNNHTDFQSTVLKHMHAAMEENDVTKADYAFLTDRIRINKGKLQTYGTQMRYNEAKETYEPYQVSDPTTVDQRRSAMGLQPMQEYVRQMNKKYQGKPKRKDKPRRLNRRI